MLESMKEIGTGAGKQERVEDGCWKAERVVVRTWSGDEGVEIVARPRGGDGEVLGWWRYGCEGVMKERRW